MTQAGGRFDTQEAVEDFWRRMASNDFHSVKPLLADDFILEWPQSGERIRGAERFARVNAEYPAQGPWRFDVRSIVAGDERAVSEVEITDGVQRAVAISFFEFADGKIRRLREFWPEPYLPPPGREHLTEPLSADSRLPPLLLGSVRFS